MVRKIVFGAVVAAFFSMGGVALSLFGQSGLSMSVSGYVKDVNSQQPIPGVKVYVFKRENGELTKTSYGVADRNGYYSIDYLDKGDYTFSASVPGIGSVRVVMIAMGGSLNDSIGRESKSLYDFEIGDGRHRFLNISLGENPYPYIEREDNELLNEINVTILYDIDDSELEFSRMEKMEPESTSCNGLTVREAKIRTVSDDIVLRGDNGKPAEGLFSFRLNAVSDSPKCVDRCKCEFGDVRGLIVPKIFLHSKNWYDKKFPFNSSKQNECWRRCALEHEKEHDAMLAQIACDVWNSYFLPWLNNLGCQTDGGCERLFEEFRREAEARMGSGLDAFEAGITKRSNQCKNDCRAVVVKAHEVVTHPSFEFSSGNNRREG